MDYAAQEVRRSCFRTLRGPVTVHGSRSLPLKAEIFDAEEYEIIDVDPEPRRPRPRGTSPRDRSERRYAGDKPTRSDAARR